LITEVFGFASGLYAYARKRLIDYRLGVSLLLARRISQHTLERGLGVLFILVAALTLGELLL
jgi:uncharacterized membrane protein YfcA